MYKTYLLPGRRIYTKEACGHVGKKCSRSICLPGKTTGAPVTA